MLCSENDLGQVQYINPDIEHSGEDFADGAIAALSVYKHLVIYRHDTFPLEVIRVLHAARDVRSILDTQ